MKTELAENGYEKIEAGVRRIENLAYDGMFKAEDKHAQFHRIVEEARKLKQILLDAVLFAPPRAAGAGKGGAA